MDSELLNQILEEDIISLSGGESDTDLMGLKEDLNTTRPYSTIGELIDGPSTHHTNQKHPLYTLPSLTH